MYPRTLAVLALALLAAGATAQRPAPAVKHDPELEVVPANEASQIDNIVRMTVELMKKRYKGETPVARGVHPKDHGCVRATFRVADDLPEHLRVGVFSRPGREYQAYVRYSNADVLIRADSTADKHGSRGMAIKLLKVEGERLVPRDEPLTQDFLLVNHPVFAFANVEDYEVLSQVLLENNDSAEGFFRRRVKTKDGKPDLSDPATVRALKTGNIIRRISSLQVDGEKGAYQTPPASPEENAYFSGAPYLFGPDRVMKYAVRPVGEAACGKPDVADPNYLRAGLTRRLSGPNAKGIVLDFQVQLRTKADLAGKLETEIEDACTEWKDPFVTVARITIPPQDFNTAEARSLCENLFFTPWHSVKEHQPIGGINRLKLGVYQASSEFRHFPKEPSGY